jgi:hypothetical protein
MKNAENVEENFRLMKLSGATSQATMALSDMFV